MPVIGEIRSFGWGEQPLTDRLRAAGWLPCNGQQYNRVDYPRLFRVLDSRWGSEHPGEVFRVPDLRGMFVRGWAPEPAHHTPESRTGDPDADNRVPIYPHGAAGNTVGSFQADTVGPHTHTFANRFPGGDHGAGYHYGEGNSDRTSSVPTRETRPKNANILHLIYAGKPHVDSDRLVDPEVAV